MADYDRRLQRLEVVSGAADRDNALAGFNKRLDELLTTWNAEGWRLEMSDEALAEFMRKLREEAGAREQESQRGRAQFEDMTNGDL